MIHITFCYTSPMREAQKIVYFVRHGQSEDNASPVFQAYDSRLNERGREQARYVAERASQLGADILISSPQPRAYETAEIISKTVGKQVVASDLFVERGKPSFVDGKPWEDARASKMYDEWDKSLYTPGYKVADGENYDEIVSRADAALAYLLKQDVSKILVVSHGHFIRTIVARVILGDTLTGDSLLRFHRTTSLENTALTVLHYREAYQEPAAWRLWTLNDHAHFAE